MQTKHIEKLEELKGYEWDHNGKEFILELNHSCAPSLKLIIKNFIAPLSHKFTVVHLFDISEKNLTELEFYGLKVILNEKPKLSQEDKEFLTQDQYFARDENGILWLYHQKPTKTAGFWECANGGKNIGFSTGINHLFPFITWESGKAWSTAELLELEVVD